MSHGGLIGATGRGLSAGLKFLFGNVLSESDISQRIENYVQKNMDISVMGKYLSTLTSRVQTDITTSQIMGDVDIEGYIGGSVNAAQVAEIKADIKSLVTADNQAEVSRNMTVKFNEELQVLQKRLSEDIAGLLDVNNGQQIVTKFIDNIRQRFDTDFSVNNIVETFNKISAQQQRGNLRVSPSAVIAGNLDAGQNIMVTSIIDSITNSISHLITHDESNVEIARAILHEQQSESTGIKSIATGIFSNMLWIWILVVVVVLIILGIILFLYFRR